MTYHQQQHGLRGRPPSATLQRDGVPTLAGRRAGHGVMTETLRLQAAARPRTAFARAVGRSPLAPQAAPWFSGAVGERRVGALLSRLERAGGWHVLHSVPVGMRGADIDHVVVGPPGVVTINTKHHPGQRVWVGARSVLVAGSRQPYLRSSEHEAQRAAALLTATLGRPVPVQAAIVVVGAASLTIKESPPSVTVIDARRLLRWLERRPAVLDAHRVAEIAAAAARPVTWQRRPITAGADPAPAFERLADEIASAARRRVAIAVVTFTTAAAAVTASAGWLLSSVL